MSNLNSRQQAAGNGNTIKSTAATVTAADNFTNTIARDSVRVQNDDDDTSSDDSGASYDSDADASDATMRPKKKLKYSSKDDTTAIKATDSGTDGVSEDDTGAGTITATKAKVCCNILKFSCHQLRRTICFDKLTPLREHGIYAAALHTLSISIDMKRTACLSCILQALRL
jgi:hypothetical protein